MCAAGMVIRQGADLGSTEHILTVEGLEPFVLDVDHCTSYFIWYVLICFTSDVVGFSFSFLFLKGVHKSRNCAGLCPAKCKPCSAG